MSGSDAGSECSAPRKPKVLQNEVNINTLLDIARQINELDWQEGWALRVQYRDRIRDRLNLEQFLTQEDIQFAARVVETVAWSIQVGDTDVRCAKCDQSPLFDVSMMDRFGEVSTMGPLCAKHLVAVLSAVELLSLPLRATQRATESEMTSIMDGTRRALKFLSQYRH